MAFKEIEVIDPVVQDFKTIFLKINKNFNSIKDYLNILGDKIIVETFTEGTSSLITLSNTYTPGHHNLLVFYNGAPQWLGDNYEEVSSNSIRLKFDRSYDDEVRVVIIRSNLIQQDISGYLADLTQLVEDSQSTFTQAEALMNRVELANQQLSSKIDELTLIQSEISSKYAEIERMYQELKSN